MQAWWSELVTEGGATPGRFAHAGVGAGETMYVVGGYAQGMCLLADAVAKPLGQLTRCWTTCYYLKTPTKTPLRSTCRDSRHS